MKPAFVVGLDGGGTKTIAELFDARGHVLSDARGGPSNFQVIGEDEASRVILDCVAECCSRASVRPADLRAVVAGLTGAGRRGDRLRMIRALKRHSAKRKLKIKRFKVESDARTALEGAFTGRAGIIVIAGTGSIVFGKDDEGNVHRAGGWGRLIGDEGSGYAIGREAFRALARIIDGRENGSRLVKLIGDVHRLRTQKEIINALYKKGFDVASVVPLVLKAAEEHDAVAMRIVHNAADELLDIIAVVAKKMRPRGKVKLPLVFVGSLLTNDNVYSRLLPRKIQARLKWVEVRPPEGSPVKGAGLMGLNA